MDADRSRANGAATDDDALRRTIDVGRQNSRALAHPLRARILAALDDAESTPTDLAALLDTSLGVVSYHVRVLADAGVIELARTTARRGAIQHHYRRAQGGGDRYCDSVELRPKAAGQLADEISTAIARAKKRSDREADEDGRRVAVTVLVQPADADDEAAA